VDIFDWLTNDEWLAILRIGVGLWWLESVRHKNLRDFLAGGSMVWVESLTRDHPLPAFASLVQQTSLSSPGRRVVTSWLVVLGECAAGVSLLFGLFTPAGLILAVFLNINYFLLAGLKGDYGEQGQNLMMILAQVVCFATAAGMTWGVDAVIFG